MVAQRMLARVAALLGVVRLLLASVGLYGVTSYSVAMRWREIAIVGSVLGAVLAIAAGFLIRRRSFGVARVDVPALGGSAVSFVDLDLGRATTLDGVRGGASTDERVTTTSRRRSCLCSHVFCSRSAAGSTSFRRVNHEELADVVHGNETDQRTLLENGNRVAVSTLEAPEDRLQHLRCLRHWALAHAIGDERSPPALR